MNLKENQCGYFAFVGIIRDTCGTYTEAKPGGWGCLEHTQQSTANACFQQLARFENNDGLPEKYVTRGAVIFVRTDCVTMEPLDDEEQDPIYRQPGVKLPRGLQAGYTQYLKRNSSIHTSEAGAGVVCNDAQSTNGSTRSDCIEALGELLQTPEKKVALLEKGKSSQVVVSAEHVLLQRRGWLH